MDPLTHCAECSAEFVRSAMGTGYGYLGSPNGPRVCYDCCAKHDREIMLKEGRITLYLEETDGKPTAVVNWPGSLRIPILGFYAIRHNWRIPGVFVWFRFEGREWTGRHYGSSHSLINLKASKPRGSVTADLLNCIRNPFRK